MSSDIGNVSRVFHFLGGGGVGGIDSEVLYNLLNLNNYVMIIMS